MKTAFRAVLPALAVALLSGTPAHAADPYQVNVIMPLTGGASFLGQAEQQALQLVEKQVNASGGIQGRPLAFVFHDDQSSPQISVQLASQIVPTHPAVMLGSSIVAMCNAIAPLMTSGPVQYCFSPGIHPKEGSYTFTSSVSTYDLARALIRYYRLKGWTKLGIITSTDASGQDAQKGIDAALALPENKDVKPVATVHFNPTDVSVAAQIETIKAASPQAMIAWTTGAPIATIFKAVVQAGLDIPVGTTDGNMTRAQMTQYASFLPKQLYIPAAEWVMLGGAEVSDPRVRQKQQDFVKVYQDAGLKPDVASALAWDPGQNVVAALRAVGPQASAADVKAWLEKLKDYAGVDGVYDFTRQPQRGLDVQNAVVTLWNPAKDTWEPMSEPAGAPLKQ
ncbi:MAG TPA: ABC transporter substrate-binding protein [Acetobacteraceae bacterium]|jgi:branched-chain amino acid transport system substrate-binding protein|nr:ABC transporter substrate-binding protein [Acetobacteraceae bacterium]